MAARGGPGLRKTAGQTPAPRATAMTDPPIIPVACHPHRKPVTATAPTGASCLALQTRIAYLRSGPDPEVDDRGRVAQAADDADDHVWRAGMALGHLDHEPDEDGDAHGQRGDGRRLEVDPGDALVTTVEQPAYGLAAAPSERDDHAEGDHDGQGDRAVQR